MMEVLAGECQSSKRHTESRVCVQMQGKPWRESSPEPLGQSAPPVVLTQNWKHPVEKRKTKVDLQKEL